MVNSTKLLLVHMSHFDDGTIPQVTNA